jgi:hypothetical protein
MPHLTGGCQEAGQETVPLRVPRFIAMIQGGQKLKNARRDLPPKELSFRFRFTVLRLGISLAT